MKWEIQSEGAFPILKCSLKIGEAIKAQAGTMMAMSDGLKITGKVDGGIGKAIGRLFSGESFFMQQAKAKEKDGWILFASKKPGGIGEIDIKPNTELMVQKDGFIAGTKDVEVSTKVQSLIKGIFGGEGLFIVKLSGKGKAFIETYGSIHVIDVTEGEEIIVDNGHLIAWESTLDYDISKGGSGLISMITAGEGFVCKFKGHGKIWVQTRNPKSFASWLAQYLPKNKGGE